MTKRYTELIEEKLASDYSIDSNLNDGPETDKIHGFLKNTDVDLGSLIFHYRLMKKACETDLKKRKLPQTEITKIQESLSALSDKNWIEKDYDKALILSNLSKSIYDSSLGWEDRLDRTITGLQGSGTGPNIDLPSLFLLFLLSTHINENTGRPGYAMIARFLQEQGIRFSNDRIPNEDTIMRRLRHTDVSQVNQAYVLISYAYWRERLKQYIPPEHDPSPLDIIFPNFNELLPPRYLEILRAQSPARIKLPE